MHRAVRFCDVTCCSFFSPTRKPSPSPCKRPSINSEPRPLSPKSFRTTDNLEHPGDSSGLPRWGLGGIITGSLLREFIFYYYLVRTDVWKENRNDNHTYIYIYIYIFFFQKERTWYLPPQLNKLCHVQKIPLDEGKDVNSILRLCPWNLMFLLKRDIKTVFIAEARKHV